MKRIIQCTILLAAMIFAFQPSHAAEPVNYYNRALGKSDEALMFALRNIIHDHTEVSYSSGLLRAFAIADVDDRGYIIDIYSNCHYKPSDNGSSASHVGEGYNREHSFPRSWFGGEVAPMNTDVFHIYPTDIKVNGQRSNFPYGVCAGGTRLSYGSYVAKGKLGTSTYPGYSGTVFEPDDEYKGDIARTYFYMATCYMSELPSWPGSPQLNYAQNRYKAFSTWTINMLMEWTRLDPVSEKEIKRNEAIYGIQGNRNPFIDHPELAEYIWGNMQSTPWNGSGEAITAEITTPRNGSTIAMGSTAVGQELTCTIDLKGKGTTKGFVLSMSDNEYFSVSTNQFTASEVNNGTSFTVTFYTDDAGTYENRMTISSEETSTTFTIVATATDEPGPGPEPWPTVTGDSITEDWEECQTGGYWTKAVSGHAWTWDFTDAGIWGDNLSHGELSCRLGKTSSSTIAMAEDFDGGLSAVSFWAGCFGSDDDANLRVDYSNDQGATWITLGSVTATKGELQEYKMPASVTGKVRIRLVQTSGSRVNIDDITLFAKPLRGDVNNDGEVTIADANLLINIILGGSADASTMKRADTNKDGEIGIADINDVIDIILAS